MNLLCDTKTLREAISNTPDKKQFDSFFTGNRTVANMPTIEIELPEAKSKTQQGTIWRDWAIAAKLLHTEKETIYYTLLTNVDFRDVWFQETKVGNPPKVSYKIKTLSKLSKSVIMDFIPRYRDFLQGKINEEHGEYVTIHWSKQENINKPDYEKGL